MEKQKNFYFFIEKEKCPMFVIDNIYNVYFNPKGTNFYLS